MCTRKGSVAERRGVECLVMPTSRRVIVNCTSFVSPQCSRYLWRPQRNRRALRQNFLHMRPTPFAPLKNSHCFPCVALTFRRSVVPSFRRDAGHGSSQQKIRGILRKERKLLREEGEEERRQQRRRVIQEAISRRQEARHFVRREQEKVRLTRLTPRAPREPQFFNAAGALAALVAVSCR